MCTLHPNVKARCKRRYLGKSPSSLRSRLHAVSTAKQEVNNKFDNLLSYTMDVLLWVALTVACTSSGQQPWMDKTLPVDARVELLLGALTNQEKTAQLNYGTVGYNPIWK